MNEDEPTHPNLLDAPTLPTVRRVQPGGKPEPAPTWPVRQQRIPQALPPRRDPPHRWLSATALGATLILLLSLFSLLILFSLMSHSGLFSRGKSAAQSSLGSATPTATSNSTAGWLQVAPTTVSFGCADHQRTQSVVLVNRGTQQVHWQANFVETADQAVISVSPGNGDLGPGESTVIGLQNTNNSTALHDVILFTPADPAAGPSASLNFTTAGCQ